MDVSRPPLVTPEVALRVVIAEDLALLRDGLTRLLEAYEFEVVAAVDDAVKLGEALRTYEPDIAVVDVRMPPTFTDEGLRAAIAARAERPGLPVLVLSQYVEQLYARELLSSGTGAVGYLLKDRVSDVATFVEAVRSVAAGGTVLDPEVVATLMARAQPDSPIARLTDRGARGARADGSGSVQHRDCRCTLRHREGDQQAHQQHLHEARPAAR